jgi:glycosyltransferase involved in cell wall biosynthesis
MKISVITAVYNRANSIARAVKSVQCQSHADVEHIVIDGASDDGTLSILHACLGDKMVLVSEPDKGIYDALNKGLSLASGEVIGLMHSDDLYANEHVLAEVSQAFADSTVDAVYGDAAFFHSGAPSELVRRYRSSRFSPKSIAWGWMPAHTALFLRRSVYERYGVFKTSYSIAADFEFVARAFYGGCLHARYIPKVWVHMQSGGASTGGWRSSLRLNQEVIRACRENGISTNWFKLLSKYPLKLLEFLK